MRVLEKDDLRWVSGGYDSNYSWDSFTIYQNNDDVTFAGYQWDQYSGHINLGWDLRDTTNFQWESDAFHLDLTYNLDTQQYDVFIQYSEDNWSLSASFDGDKLTVTGSVQF